MFSFKATYILINVLFSESDAVLEEKYFRQYNARKWQVSRLLSKKKDYKLPQYLVPREVNRNCKRTVSVWNILMCLAMVFGFIISPITALLLFALSLWRNVFVPVVLTILHIATPYLQTLEQTYLQFKVSLSKIFQRLMQVFNFQLTFSDVKQMLINRYYRDLFHRRIGV